MGVADNETMAFINETYQRADAFLFGRRTYELFAGYWGRRSGCAAAEDPRNHLITDALNTKPSTSYRPHSPNRAGRTRPSSPATSRGHRRAESEAGEEPAAWAAAPWSGGCSITTSSTR